MDKLELTEKEAIELTIEYGYKGDELTSAKYKKLGCLDGQKDKVTNQFKEGGMVKFIRKLETIYQSVEVIGKGKKRTYILKGLRNEVLPIEDKRKFNGVNESDQLMSHYFFNRLLEADLNKARTTYQWAIDVGAYNPALIDKKLIKDLFYELYYGEDLDFIQNQFITYLKNRHRSFTDISLKLLKQENKINVLEQYMCLDEDDEVYSIHKNQFDRFNDRKQAILQAHNLNGFNYLYHIHKNEKLRAELFGLTQDTGIKQVWIGYKIELLSKEPYPDVNFKQFQKLYWDKTITLISKLPQETKKTLSFANMYRKYNYATIIESLGYKNEMTQLIIEQEAPESFHITLMMINRQNKGFKMSDAWCKEEREWEALINGKPSSVEEKDVSEKVGPKTIDDFLNFSDFDIPDVAEFEPVISDYTMQEHTYNKELDNAISQINLAFGKQYLN